MGARPEQQLALSFLAALTAMWAEYPGTYEVEEVETDLVPALAQMCIKSLAADVRDSVPPDKQRGLVVGELSFETGETSRPTIRDVVNKVVHGAPQRVVVTDADVHLHFVNKGSAASRRWIELWFSGQSVLGELDRLLYNNRDLAPQREREITAFLERLGADRFLPTRVSVP